MLLSCGDALIDFMPVKAADGRDAYVTAVGGSCLNVAVAMARLDAPAGLVGGVSTDLFGAMIADHAVRSNVDLTFAVRSTRETTLAFVRFVEGEPHYAFYDESSAARHWTYASGTIPFATIDAVHVGSTTLIHEPTSSQTLALVEDARGVTTISFDPNCRPALVRDKADYVRRMEAFAARATIVRMSDVDFEFLYGDLAHDDKASALLTGGAALVVLTRGAQGVTAWHRQAGKIEVAAPPVRLVDTIGAGDSFQGALLAALRELGRIEARALAAMEADELGRALSFAVTCAAITCGRVGADPPYREEVDFRLV
ncbi:MAG: PfkB domain protein [Xanthobacteraceae bacterium]|jgi:fructokinase|nr:PfkB domain protein [Xanthobacteraceae bacterium]